MPDEKPPRDPTRVFHPPTEQIGGAEDEPVAEEKPSTAPEDPPSRDGTRVFRPPTQKVGGTADEPAPEEAAPTTPGDPLLGASIGDTRIRACIGEGGMGVIYEGWQEPPGRTVAVKVLRQAVASDEARYRFEHEARVVASLHHPAIAQVHRVGTHRADRELPYFLMEYVPDARTLEEYVAEEGLDTEATLRLFIEVCRGVQAGHAKGVIHRDLKPANILVDGEGRPKVIDFGIARVSAQDETDQTPKTTTGEVVGTVPYMGPEQFTGQRDDIDTRTDVYALGVVLFETLTGELPYDFGERGLLDVIRMVQTEPPTPLGRLRPELAGDLAVIVGKALAKDPERRYASAAALADDLERFLEKRPILARPPSLRYQIRMYAKRRKATFAAILGVAASVVFALVAVSIYARGEARARDKAEREEAKARTLLHASARVVPDIAKDLEVRLARIVGTTDVRRILAEKLEQLASRLAAVEGAADDPEVAHAMGAAELAVARIRGGMGAANFGDGSASLERFERAVQHFARAHEEAPADPRFRRALVEATLTLANHYRAIGRFDDARRTLAAADTVLSDGPTEEMDFGTLLEMRYMHARASAHLLWELEKPQAALAAYESAHAALLAFEGSESHREGRMGLLLGSHLDLATTLLRLERGEEAAAHIEALTAIAGALDTNRSKAKTRQMLWYVQMKLAEFAAASGELELARDRRARALALAQEAAADDPHDMDARMRVRLSRGELGAALEALGDNEGAREQHAAALEAVREERSRDPGNATLEWDLRVALVRLATTEGQLGAYEAARRRIDEARTIQARRARERPERMDETAGIADVEYAAAAVELARAGKAQSLEESIAAYEAAAARLGAAVKALEPMESTGKLRPSDASNLAIWRQTLSAIEEALTKLRAMR